MKKVDIYTDGACSGNPGPGGWGAILVCSEPKAEKELSGGEKNTTNNRMEMMAVIQALKALKKPCEITITTDSKYVCDAFLKRWLQNWIRNGWKTAAKKPVKNEELWKEMKELVDMHQVSWKWIKGHAGHHYNERADQLAVKAREEIC